LGNKFKYKTSFSPAQQPQDKIQVSHRAIMSSHRIPSSASSAVTAIRDGGTDHGDEEPASPVQGGGDASESQPLLGLSAPDEDTWKPPRHFLLIELAIFSNVFLYGFDSTITAATYAIISSEFDAVNTASWLTTSYLVTSTAFQPLYGRISDIFGRRVCFFISTITFALGCLGCGVAQDFVLLNLMRALTGFGGGGLMTMGTYKTLQNPVPEEKRKRKGRSH
jgi:hypothetical protein